MLSTRPQALIIAIVSSLLALGLMMRVESPSVSTPNPNWDTQASKIQTNDYIIQEAKRYLGDPYGHGPGAWTCSEYTRAVYGGSVGVWMPSWHVKQLNYGWEPRRTKRGDLFFYDEAGYGEITHVAIYMGKGKIIHASKYFGDVHISYSRYMAYAFVEARRIR